LIKKINGEFLSNIFQNLTAFKSERLSVNTKLTLYKALIRSITTYACPACEFAADSHVLKLQRLQNKPLQTTDNVPRRTPTRDLDMAFKIP